MRVAPNLPHLALAGRIATWSVVAVVAMAGCGDAGGDTSRTAGCGAGQQERFDPASANHVLTGAPEPDYLTDPPTSGPHAPIAARSGVVDRPMSRPQQVGHLEAGGVILQHGDLPDDQQAALDAMASEGVLVVPSDDLPAPIVATAWVWKLTCDNVDTGAIAAFVDAHRDQAPGTDG